MKLRCVAIGLVSVIAIIGMGSATVGAPASETAAASSIGRKLVGMYAAAPGSISDCGPPYGWPDILPTNPSFNGGQEYTTDNAAYLDYMLTSTAAMGVDFLMVDVSNGIHYGCPPIQQSLLLLLDTADARIRNGVPTPHITIMSPGPGAGGPAVDGPGGYQAHDNDWIYDNIVYAGGVPRPSYMWINGFPLWGVYTRSPFRTDFRDPRYFIRYICNSANNDCHQQQIDSGVVWAWGTRGNADTPDCPATSNGSASCPLASSNSNQITIQNGYQNKIPCKYHWPPGVCTPPIEIGFTAAYYDDQWNFATAHTAGIILINMYDGIEGGWIQSRNGGSSELANFSPPTVFEDLTRTHVSAWKGGLGLADLGPPPPPPTPQPPASCGRLQPNEGLLQNQSLSSCSGRFKLIMQPDGNAVLYDGSRWLWQTATLGPAGAGGFELIMQPDGNLVVYASSGTPVWDSKTFGNPDATLAVQDDGNLVIYQGATSIWQTYTQQPTCQELPSGASLGPGRSVVSCTGGYTLIMQDDGNLVLYNGSWAPIWSAPGTLGRGHHLVMQFDGNLVVYDSANSPVWDTHTFGNPGAHLSVQPDSNIVVYSADGRALWSRY